MCQTHVVTYQQWLEICPKPFTSDNEKFMDHCHMTGNFRGVAHRQIYVQSVQNDLLSCLPKEHPRTCGVFLSFYNKPPTAKIYPVFQKYIIQP